jgi:hypothetical protein
MIGDLKMNTMKIETIKKEAYKSPYFFDSSWLYALSQSMEDFKVAKSPKGNIYIYAPGRLVDRTIRYTFARFIDHDLKIIEGEFNTDTDIVDYINYH